MKAKVIKTGEIVDVYHEPQHGQITNIYKESVLVNGRMWSEEELYFCIKANEAPKKIWVHELAAMELNVPLKAYHVEYTRTDYAEKEFLIKAKRFLSEIHRVCDITDENGYRIELRDLQARFENFYKETKI